MIWFTMWHSFSRSFPNLLTKADAHVLSFTDKTTLSLETVAGAALPGLPTWSILCNSSCRLVHELRNSTRLRHWLWTGMKKFSEMFLVFIFCNLQHNRLYTLYVAWLNQGICYGDADSCAIYVYICAYFCAIIFFYNVLIL